MGNLLF